jgi:hypothetical protein
MLRVAGPHNARGDFAPFLFAAVSLVLSGGTFARDAKKSRSDEIMERARKLHHLHRSAPGLLVALTVLVLVALIVVSVIAILTRS